MNTVKISMVSPKVTSVVLVSLIINMKEVKPKLTLFPSSLQGDDDLKDTGFHLTTSNQGASAVGPGFSLKF